MNTLRSKFFGSVALACLLASHAFAQFSIHKGEQVLQFSGLVTAFYNYRYYQSTETDYKKNRFGVRDAQLDVSSWWSNKLKFKVKVDFADLVAGAAAGDQSGLMEATATITPLIKGPEFKIGFDKPNFSRFALTETYASPFYDRPEMDDGLFYPSRDIGVTVTQGMKADRIIASAGIYNGNGEASLAGSNETSGNPEYVARLEFNFPSKLRYTFFPIRNDAKPLFNVAFNARYQDKRAFPNDEYNLSTVDGKKWLYGIDAAAQWKGIQLTAEILQARIIPNDTARVSGSGGNYYRAGGYALQAVYFERHTNLLFAARYDWFNPNDLVHYDNRGSTDYAIAYHIPGTLAWFKAQYMQHHPLDGTTTVWKDNELRAGFQLRF